MIRSSRRLSGHRTSREIHLWRAACPAVPDPDRLARWRAVLSTAELERADGFAFERDRTLYLVAHALLRGALSSHAAVEPGAWVFRAGPHGKPEVAAPSTAGVLRFNLAHARGLAVVAVAERMDVGVDVEPVDREVDLGLAARFFSPAEASYVAAAPDEATARTRFLDLWTLKEAYVKAVGGGLSMPLDGFTVRAEEDPPTVSSTRAADPDPREWHLYRHVHEGAYRIAVAARADQGRRPRLRLRGVPGLLVS